MTRRASDMKYSVVVKRSGVLAAHLLAFISVTPQSIAHADAFSTTTSSSIISNNLPYLLQRRSRPLTINANVRSKNFFSVNDVTCISRGGASLRVASSNENGPSSSTALTKVMSFVSNNFFLVGMLAAVLFAKVAPSVGRNGGIIRPELFIGNLGVTMIFLLSGLSLETSELTKAATNLKLNGLIQLVIFGAWPALIGVPLTWSLRTFLPTLIPPALVDGLLILTCLPTTVNMNIMLSSAGGGSVATSIINSVIANMGGIFLTPALLLHFFGTEITLPFLAMVAKLCNKVLLPVAIGQVMRATPAKEIYTMNSKKFKRLQEIILLGIVYNAFCNAFSSGLGIEFSHSLALMSILPAMHLLSLGGLFKFFSLKLFKLSRPEIVSAMFCASQKTLAFGLPLVNTIFEGNSNLAAYCAPIMFIHPLQMIIGSLLLPNVNMYTEAYKDRMGEGK